MVTIVLGVFGVKIQKIEEYLSLSIVLFLTLLTLSQWNGYNRD